MNMKYIIVGAGISGLSIGQVLKEYGHDVQLFEADSRPGGMVKCDRVHGHLFHRTGGHVFNTKRQDVLDWFWSHFDKKDEFTMADRNSVVSMADNTIIAYPIENHAYQLSDEMMKNFINDIADSWKCSICIGSGNEGLGAVHTGGTLTEDMEETVELAVSSYETGLSIQIWKDYWDDIAVEIIAPSGRNLGRIQENSRVSRIRYEDMELLTYFGEPSPFRIRQEIYIDMIPQTVYIQSGLWKLRLIPRSIRNGRYDMWLPAQGALNFGTGFTSPDSASTFTIPSAAAKAVTVGAYDAGTGSAAPFSGQGYIVEIGGSLMVKPELAAPGVNVLVPSVSGMARASGTSYATPFVTGSAALLMEWGIVRGNDAFLYGEKLKAYLIKGAEPLAGAAVPDTQTGWGRLCLKNSLPQA